MTCDVFTRLAYKDLLAPAGSEKQESKQALKAPQIPQNGSEPPTDSQGELKWKLLDWKEYQRAWEVIACCWAICVFSLMIGWCWNADPTIELLLDWFRTARSHPLWLKNLLLDLAHITSSLNFASKAWHSAKLQVPWGWKETGLGFAGWAITFLLTSLLTIPGILQLTNTSLQAKLPKRKHTMFLSSGWRLISFSTLVKLPWSWELRASSKKARAVAQMIRHQISWDVICVVDFKRCMSRSK